MPSVVRTYLCMFADHHGAYCSIDACCLRRCAPGVFNSDRALLLLSTLLGLTLRRRVAELSRAEQHLKHFEGQAADEAMGIATMDKLRVLKGES